MLNETLENNPNVPAAHAAIKLQGMNAYADHESVPAGEAIRFHVSSQVPYRFKVTRLGTRVDDRASDVTVYRRREQRLLQRKSAATFFVPEAGTDWICGSPCFWWSQERASAGLWS